MNHALEQCPAAPIRTENVRAYGVDYKWIHIENSGDLFVTRFGEPWLDFLHPKHWYDNNSTAMKAKDNRRESAPFTVFLFTGTLAN